ncbi:hypothetical protein [Orientia tsutsugamushi]|uniref:hypothetical protein n=1 Tax=Orientia tsutsugamushi TaxID=784 RepID=UPI003528D645
MKEVYDLYINQRRLKDSSKSLYKGIMNNYLKNLHYIHEEDIYKIFNNRPLSKLVNVVQNYKCQRSN